MKINKSLKCLSTQEDGSTSVLKNVCEIFVKILARLERFFSGSHQTTATNGDYVILMKDLMRFCF